MANIETEKFNDMVQAIGSDTINAKETSGPEMQVCIVCVFVCEHTCVWLVHVSLYFTQN